jgi:hypothetical protein
MIREVLDAVGLFSRFESLVIRLADGGINSVNNHHDCDQIGRGSFVRLERERKPKDCPRRAVHRLIEGAKQVQRSAVYAKATASQGSQMSAPRAAALARSF